jgi:glucose/arabinose dehydrogenase
MKKLILPLAVAAFLGGTACSSVAQNSVVTTQGGRVAVDVVARGLANPWGIAFLPDGHMLVTERTGRLRLVARDGRLTEIVGVPQVYASGQGGLLDVALDPGFATNALIYLSYAEPGGNGASTAVARGRLNAGRTALDNVQVIFRQEPKVSGTAHYGSRLVFARDGTLFITTGERFKFQPAQDLASHLGKIVRVRPDGSVPPDNPFVGRPGALPEIWSYGHRNVQGAAIHPQTGALWALEFGPRHGDELNIAEAGRNYGWPVVSWGEHYGGQEIPKPPTRPDLADAVKYWVPGINPSGMTFYTGNLLPAWRGNLLIAGLGSRGLVRLTVDGARVTGEERIGLGDRIRQVQQGPDGAVYALTDKSSGEILRLTPAK